MCYYCCMQFTQRQLSLKDTLPSGQCFRFSESDGVWTVKAGVGENLKILKVSQDNLSPITEDPFWANFFDLGTDYEALKAAGYNIVGVSKDSEKSHAGFAEKHALPFTLLADTTKEMHEAFGAIGEKKMYGKTVLGTLRRTFIFDENGILQRIIEKVDTKNAARQILEG